jgi:hypothetical protein
MWRLHDPVRIAAGLVAVILGLLVGPAMADSLLATAETPATLTVQPRPAAAGLTASGRRRLTVTVMNYRPAADCTPVEIVVIASGAAGAGERELGRFGLTPAAAFDAASPSAAQRFSFALPPELSGGAPVTLSVRLVLRHEARPAAASCASEAAGSAAAADAPDKGPYVRLGGAEIH